MDDLSGGDRTSDGMRLKRIYVLWPIYVVGSISIFLYLLKRLSPEDRRERRLFLVRYAITGALFVVFSFAVECLGVNAGLWYNETSLYEFGGFKVSVEEIPLEFFAGVFWLMLYNTFEERGHRFVFFVTSAGTVSYIIALMVRFGFLVHDKWYNIGWTFPYWLANLGFLVLCDSAVSKRLPAAGRNA